MSGTCLVCGTPLDAEDDPLSRSCGGDCWGCVGLMEEGDPSSDAVVRAEKLACLRDPEGNAVRGESIGDQAFYEGCARLLGTSYDCKPFVGHKRTRWNNRAPGGGRFPGFGLIRLFGDHVHIALHAPFQFNLAVRGRRDALSALARAAATHSIGDDA